MAVKIHLDTGLGPDLQIQDLHHAQAQADAQGGVDKGGHVEAGGCGEGTVLGGGIGEFADVPVIPGAQETVAQMDHADALAALFHHGSLQVDLAEEIPFHFHAGTGVEENTRVDHGADAGILQKLKGGLVGLLFELFQEVAAELLREVAVKFPGGGAVLLADGGGDAELRGDGLVGDQQVGLDVPVIVETADVVVEILQNLHREHHFDGGLLLLLVGELGLHGGGQLDLGLEGGLMGIHRIVQGDLESGILIDLALVLLGSLDGGCGLREGPQVQGIELGFPEPGFQLLLRFAERDNDLFGAGEAGELQGVVDLIYAGGGVGVDTVFRAGDRNGGGFIDEEHIARLIGHSAFKGAIRPFGEGAAVHKLHMLEIFHIPNGVIGFHEDGQLRFLGPVPEAAIVELHGVEFAGLHGKIADIMALVLAVAFGPGDLLTQGVGDGFHRRGGCQIQLIGSGLLGGEDQQGTGGMVLIHSCSGVHILLPAAAHGAVRVLPGDLEPVGDDGAVAAEIRLAGPAFAFLVIGQGDSLGIILIIDGHHHHILDVGGGAGVACEANGEVEFRQLGPVGIVGGGAFQVHIVDDDLPVFVGGFVRGTVDPVAHG